MRAVTPYVLDKFIQAALTKREVKVAEAEKSRWLQSPCTTALMQELLDKLLVGWMQCRNAATFEERRYFEGYSLAIEELLDYPQDLETPADFTPREDAEQVRQLMEDFCHGTADE